MVNENVEIKNYIELDLEITEITILSPIVGYIYTKIAKWERTDKYKLSSWTTPEIGFIDIDKKFDTVEKAIKYYIENCKIYFEEMNKICQNIDIDKLLNKR